MDEWPAKRAEWAMGAAKAPPLERRGDDFELPRTAAVVPEGVKGMGRFGWIMRDGRTRVTTVILATMVLLAAVSGIAWAVGSVTKGKGVQQAATYHVVLPLGGVDGVERSVSWTVGRVTLEAAAFSGIDESGCNLFGGQWLGVRNDGPQPIIVVPGESTPEVGATLIAPAEETLAGTGGDQVGGIAYDPACAPDQPAANGGIGTFGIFDEGGASANGIFSWSFRFNAADDTGHFSFTLQMRG